MRERIFRFKHFTVNHSVSAMKVGVDGVLIGAWANLDGAKTILDVGCGCGLITLMCAQRNQIAKIYGVEIEPGAAGEAKRNFDSSQWSNRIELSMEDALVCGYSEIDYIISNPPFFSSGVDDIKSERELARHCNALNPYSVIDIAERVGGPSAKIAMIFPASFTDKIIEYGVGQGWRPIRLCRVRGHENAPVKRVLAEFCREFAYKETDLEDTELILEMSRGIPTDEYRSLCSDFYLKF